MSDARGLLGDRGARSHFWKALAAAGVLALAACAAPTPAVAPPQAAVSVWGDRTIAVVAPKSEPTLAYFAPGGGTGALYVWDAGEDGIARGDWRLADGGRVCASLDVFHREGTGRGSLRPLRPVCFDPEAGAAARASYRGDVFQLNGKSQPPYILSAADNERLMAALEEAGRASR